MEAKPVTESKPQIPQFGPGDTVKVSIKVVEGDKERTQTFQGVVIKVGGSGPAASFTVRRISYGVGVERTFLLRSPHLEKVELLRRGKVRRARLYYLRGLTGKAGRIAEKRGALATKEKAEEEAPPAEA